MERLRKVGHSLIPALAAAIIVITFADVAHATLGGNFEAESENLLLRVARWYQRVSMTFVILAYMEGGTRFFNPDTNQGAKSHMWKVFWGSVFVLGSVGIAELLKASFSGKF